jgi:hypothetical protein
VEDQTYVASGAKSSHGRRSRSRVRRTTVLAFDIALVIGTVAAAGLFGAGTSSATAPVPGWAAQQALTPSAPAPATNPVVTLTDVTCNSAVSCIAVGTYTDSSTKTIGLIESLSGATWTAAPAPLPADAATGVAEISSLSSVSCPTTGSCVAVGQYTNTLGQPVGLIDSLTAGVWSNQVAPLPSDAVLGATEVNSLNSVSCASAANCSAVGGYKGTGATSEGLIETMTGGTAWTAATAPQPAGAVTQATATLEQVSCPSSTTCVATGKYETPSTGTVADLLSESSGTWSAEDVPLPTNAGTGAAAGSQLTGLSCAGGTCEAVGKYFDSSGVDTFGLLERYAGGAWAATQAPEPADAGQGTNQAAYVSSVSCTAAGYCAAVGKYENTSGNTTALILSLTTGAPTVQLAPQPTNAATTPKTDSSLAGVSCVASGDCTAVGAYLNNSGSLSDVGLIETESAGTWSAAAAPLPSTAAIGTAQVSQLADVSCTSRGACDAVGGFTDTAANSQGVIETLTPAQGYWEVAGDGGIFSFGNAVFHGSTGSLKLNKPIVGMAATPGDAGYWLVASDGGIFSFGNAVFYGSTGNIVLNKPIVGMAATPDGRGYWLVASDGGIFSFGDATFYGSTGNIVLNKPIVGMAATPDGRGYWLVASDGGIFSFGDAAFHGSTGSLTLNKPIVGMSTTPTGNGYWLVASDGGIFAFGDAAFQGSTGNIALNKPIVGMLSTYDGAGYWLLASDGGIFSFGDATFHGSEGGTTLNSPVVNGAPS